MAFQHVAGRNLMLDYADGITIAAQASGNEFSKTQDSGHLSKAFLPSMLYEFYSVTGEHASTTLPP